MHRSANTFIYTHIAAYVFVFSQRNISDSKVNSLLTTTCLNKVQKYIKTNFSYFFLAYFAPYQLHKSVDAIKLSVGATEKPCSYR